MPTFAISVVDRPGSTALRLATRAAHLAHIAAHRDRIVFGGPLKDVDGETTVGGWTVVDMATQAEAQAFMDADPYTKAGLFETVAIRRIQIMVPEPEPGFLEAESARAAGAS